MKKLISIFNFWRVFLPLGLPAVEEAYNHNDLKWFQFNFYFSNMRFLLTFDSSILFTTFLLFAKIFGY
jgi:hypothetical protein